MSHTNPNQRQLQNTLAQQAAVRDGHVQVDPRIAAMTQPAAQPARATAPPSVKPKALTIDEAKGMAQQAFTLAKEGQYMQAFATLKQAEERSGARFDDVLREIRSLQRRPWVPHLEEVRRLVTDGKPSEALKHLAEVEKAAGTRFMPEFHMANSAMLRQWKSNVDDALAIGREDPTRALAMIESIEKQTGMRLTSEFGRIRAWQAEKRQAIVAEAMAAARQGDYATAKAKVDEAEKVAGFPLKQERAYLLRLENVPGMRLKQQMDEVFRLARSEGRVNDARDLLADLELEYGEHMVKERHALTAIERDLKDRAPSVPTPQPEDVPTPPARAEAPRHAKAQKLERIPTTGAPPPSEGSPKKRDKAQRPMPAPQPVAEPAPSITPDVVAPPAPVVAPDPMPASNGSDMPTSVPAAEAAQAAIEAIGAATTEAPVGDASDGERYSPALHARVTAEAMAAARRGDFKDAEAILAEFEGKHRYSMAEEFEQLEAIKQQVMAAGLEALPAAPANMPLPEPERKVSHLATVMAAKQAPSEPKPATPDPTYDEVSLWDGWRRNQN